MFFDYIGFVKKILFIENQLKCLSWFSGQDFTGNEFILSNRAPKVANAILVEGELETGTHVSFDEFLSLGQLKNQIRSFQCVCRWVLKWDRSEGNWNELNMNQIFLIFVPFVLLLLMDILANLN